MTPHEIEQLDNADLDFVTFQCVCSALPSGNVPNAASVQALPAGQQMALLTSLLELEVLNGGFNQYFFNRSDAFAALTLSGYRLIEADRCANILSAALAVYHTEQAQKQGQNEPRTLQAFSASYQTTQLVNYDADFCRAIEGDAQSHSVEALRTAYIRRHLQAEFPLLLTDKPAAILANYRARKARMFDTA